VPGEAASAARAFPSGGNRSRFPPLGNRSSLLFVVTALVFLLVAIAMIAAVGGRRAIAGGLFGLSFALSVVWLVLHMTGPLNLSF